MRFLIGIALLVALVALLYWAFPHSAPQGDDRFQILYYGILLIPVLGGAAFLRGAQLRESVRDIALWVAIALALVLGYSYRDVLLNNRVAAELLPARPRILADGTIQVRAAEDGHFHVVAQVNGVPVRFMVDTGASDIVLSPADAKRAGYNLERLKYTRRYETANGTVGGAPVKIGRMEVGAAYMTEVEASVNQAAMDQSLLGMSYLRKFRSYRVEGDTLTLVP